MSGTKVTSCRDKLKKTKLEISWTDYGIHLWDEIMSDCSTFITVSLSFLRGCFIMFTSGKKKKKFAFYGWEEAFRRQAAFQSVWSSKTLLTKIPSLNPWAVRPYVAKFGVKCSFLRRNIREGCNRARVPPKARGRLLPGPSRLPGARGTRAPTWTGLQVVLPEEILLSGATSASTRSSITTNMW